MRGVRIGSRPHGILALIYKFDRRAGLHAYYLGAITRVCISNTRLRIGRSGILTVVFKKMKSGNYSCAENDDKENFIHKSFIN